MAGTIKVDKSWKKNMKILNVGLIEAARLTLNAQALEASKQQKIQLNKMFELRNKFSEGSIFPKLGNRYGLIPPNRKNINSMYARSGTIQDYLAEQNEGFDRSDPQVPTDSARIGKKFKRVIGRKSKLRNLKREPTLRAKSFKRQKTIRSKTRAMIAMAKRVNWKGLIHIRNQEAGIVNGYFRMSKGKLMLIRYSQSGLKRRKAHHWHEKALKSSPTTGFSQAQYNKAANLKLSKLK